MFTGLTLANIEDRLTSCFLEFWNNRTPVILKNQVQQELPDNVNAWVHYTVYRNASAQDSFGTDGNRRFVRIGRVFAEVFVRTGYVTGLQNELVVSIVDYYEQSTWSPLRIRQILQADLPDGAHRRASITGDGAWFGTQVNVQWAFDQKK